METNHKNAIRKFIKDNFQYNPEYNRPIIRTLKKGTRIESFESIKFLQNEEISNLFIFHSLKILKSLSIMRNDKKVEISRLLFHLFSLFDNFEYQYIINEIQLPFRFSIEIANCFGKENNKKDFASFLLFNTALLLKKSLDVKFYESMNFNLINVLYLYEYIFIESNSEKAIQIVVVKIITILFNHMVQIQESNK